MPILQLRAPRPTHPTIRSLACLVALAALALAAPPLASAARTEKVTTATYVVTGSTANEIRASLDERRPAGYDARTSWYVSWSYTSRVRNGRCRVATSKVHTRIGFTYPRWKAPADADPALRTRWATYMRNLRVHEAGHARIGRAVAARVHASMARASARTCRALDRALPGIVNPHYRWGNRADIAYDRRTGHGATQGAVFP